MTQPKRSQQLILPRVRVQAGSPHLVTQTACPSVTLWIDGTAYTVPRAVARCLQRLRRLAAAR